MSLRGRWLAAALLSAVLTTSGDARAALSEAERAAVLSLYQQSKTLLAEGKVAAACEKLEEGKRIDAGAINLLLRLAACYEALGKTATAMRQYDEVAQLARSQGDARATEAATKAAAASARVAKVVLDVPAATRVPGLVVRLDGIVIVEASWGEGLAVDPGTHAIEVSAPGRKTRATRAEAPTIGVVRVAVAPLDLDAATAPRIVASTAPPRDDRGDAQRTVAWAIGGAGLVGVGVGAAFGLVAIGQHDASNDGHCDAQSFCDDEGLALRDEAQTAGTISTIAFAVGAAGLAGGLVLWLTAPEDETSLHATGSAHPGGATLSLHGAF